MKRGNGEKLLFFITIALLSVGFTSASINVTLADQGSGVVTTSTGLLLESGNLTVSIHDAVTGGNTLYTETFTGAIVNGSWNVMLGEIVGLPLEYGSVNYKDYLINGEDADFINGSGDTVGRQFFHSPLGDINASAFLKNGGIHVTETGLVGIGTSSPAGQLSLGATTGSQGAFQFNETSGTLQFSNDNATTWTDVGSGSGSSGNTTEIEFAVVRNITNAQTTSSASYVDIVGSNFTLVNTGTYEVSYVLAVRQSSAVQNSLFAITDSNNNVINGSTIDWFPKIASGNEVVTKTVLIENVGSNTYKMRFASQGGSTTTIYNIEANGSGATGDSSIIYKQLASSVIVNSTTINTNISAVGGSFYGSLKWAGASGCSFTGSGVSASRGILTHASCDDKARTSRGLTTSLLTVGDAIGQNLSIKFDSLPAGYYSIIINGDHANNLNNGVSVFSSRIREDHSINSTAISWLATASAAEAGFGSATHTLYVPSDRGESNIELLGDSDSTVRSNVADEREASISVYYFPSFGTAKNDTVFSDLDGDTRINTDAEGSDSDNITFFTAGTQRAVIDSTGNIGIGTTSPAYSLDVEGTSKSQTTSVDGFNNITEQGSWIGWNRDAASGRTAIVNQRGAGIGGFEWLPYNSSNDLIDNTPSMTLTGDGLLGIGTTSPESPLSVSGSNNLTESAGPSISISNSGTGDAAVTWLLPGIRRWYAGIDNSDSDKFKLATTAGTGTFDDSSLLTVEVSGNVGIGTTSPTGRLTITNSSGTVMFNLQESSTLLTLGSGGSSAVGLLHVGDMQVINSCDSEDKVCISGEGGARNIVISDQDNYTSFWTNSTEKVRITGDGNVGIGRTSPNGKLDVAGDIHMTGARTKLFYQGDSEVSQRGSLAFYTPDNGVTAIITPHNSTGGAINSTIRLGGFGSFDSSEVSLAVSGGLAINKASLTAGVLLDVSGGDLLVSETSNGTETAGAVISIAQSGTGDAVLTAFVPGRRWYWGIDNSDGDSFKYATTVGSLNFSVDTKMTIDTAGNVGIGITSPTKKLEVGGIIKSQTLVATEFSITEQGTWIGWNRQVGSGVTSFANGRGVGTGGFEWLLYNSSNGLINNETSMVIDGTGKVGIGTTSPTNTIHIAGVGDPIRAQRFIADSSGSIVYLEKSRNATVGGHTVVQSGDALGGLIIRGSDGNSFESVGRISMEVDGTPGEGDMPGRITFYTTPDGSIINNEQMRIDSNGNVGIGTTSPNGKLDVAGDIHMTGARTKLFYQGDSGVSQRGSIAFYTPDNGVTAIITPHNNTGGVINSTIRLGGFGSFDSAEVSLAVSGGLAINKASLTAGALLDVSGGDLLVSETSGGTETAGAQISIAQSGTGDAVLTALVPGRRWYWGIDNSDGDSFKYATTAGSGNFSVDTKMTIDTVGNVGIGTSSPSGALDIQKFGGTAMMKIGDLDTNDGTTRLLVQNRWTGNDNFGLHIQGAGGFTHLGVMGDGGVGVGAGRTSGRFEVHTQTITVTGTITTGGTTVTGSGTLFTTELQVGSNILTTLNQSRRVTVITNATSLTIDTAFSPDVTIATAFLRTIPSFYVNSANGDVGIGTVTPELTLGVSEINTGEDIDGAGISLSQGSTGDVIASWLITGRRWYAGIDNSDNDKWKLAATDTTPDFSTDTKLTVTPNGSVGIGITNPTDTVKLHISGTGTTGNSYVNMQIDNLQGGAGEIGDGADLIFGLGDGSVIKALNSIANRKINDLTGSEKKTAMSFRIVNLFTTQPLVLQAHPTLNSTSIVGINVPFGQSPSTHALNVIGDINATGSIFKNGGTALDYIFEHYYGGEVSATHADYEGLLTYEELEAFVAEHHYLPNLEPSSYTGQVEVGYLPDRNLENIEANTLRDIEDHYRLKQIEEENNALKQTLCDMGRGEWC